MTSLFPAQRAAEEFDSVLEGRATTAVAERYTALAATVQVLRDQPEVLPRAAFVADLRERLMLAAETDLVAAPPVVRRLPSKARRNRRIGTLAASLVIVGGSAGMAAAASGALPGEALYPIKRGVEQVQVASHFGDASKGAALLGQAGTRLDEIQAMTASGSTDTDLLDSTVADFRSSANSGADKLFKAYQSDADTADVTTVRDFTASAMSQVADMAASGDPSTAGALRDTADALADIDQQATTLCSTCGGATLSTPDILAGAAGAPSVVNLIARPAKQATKDVQAYQAAQAATDEAKLNGLKNKAQGAADELAKSSKSGGTSSLTGTVAGTLTSTGEVVPNLVNATGSAVSNLVGGVTGSITEGAKGGDLTTTVKGTGDALGKTLDGVTGPLNDTLSDLTKGLAPQN
jgi:hypothetical protein